MKKPKIAILGLGEAGSHFANDLARLGYTVSGWDPDLKRTLDEKIHIANNNAHAVEDADVVFNVNLSSVAKSVAEEIKHCVKKEAIFCEMNTSSPFEKKEIQSILKNECTVLDVAIMAPVPKAGIQTPFLVSGENAIAFRNYFSELPNIQIIEAPVGKAAELKLLRSIVYKGVAAVICEAMEVAEKFDSVPFMEEQISSIMGGDKNLIERFVEGSKKHAIRRSHEMEAVTSMLKKENLSALMSKAALDNLSRYVETKKDDPSTIYEEKQKLKKAFLDIPGTYVFTPDHSRKGYELNMFCMSLNEAENREKFRADEKAYVDLFPMTEEQKQAVLNREWLEMLRLGGNIYYTFKIAIFDRKSMQHVGGKMSGMTEEEFKDMMLSGGRSIIGNRSKIKQSK